jgi:hypothetical protein
MEELIEVYEKYINLLNEELNELVSVAYIHGWKSKRVEEGQRLRDEIDKVKSVFGF